MFGDIVLHIWIIKVERAGMVSQKEDIVDSIIEGGSESNRKALKSPTHQEDFLWKLISPLPWTMRTTSSGPYSIGDNTSGKALWLMEYLLAGTSMSSAS